MSVPVLEEIAKKVSARLSERKKTIPIEQLIRTQPSHKSLPFESLFDGTGIQIIAEIKKSSPSEGPIAPSLDPVTVAHDYLSAGATALSVLTEPDFFSGSLEYLKSIRARFPKASLLMKDFILDEYQILEGRLAGADAVLLIVAMLDEKTGHELLLKARRLNLEALVEVHDEGELKKAVQMGATFIGVNNRNLKTMQISLKTSENLAKLAPSNVTLISESGLKSSLEIKELRMLGYKGFLMGTSFMKTGAPGQALKKILEGSV